MSTNCDESSPTPVAPRLLLTLVIPNYSSTRSARGEKKPTLLSVIPSWNDVLQLEPWARRKRKQEIQQAFLSALLRSADALSTRTTFAKNSFSIAADTLVSSLEIRRQKSELRRANAKLLKAKKSMR